MVKLFKHLLVLFPSFVFSQIGPESWQDHISINSCNSVTKCRSTIYASYRAGLVHFDEKEISPVTLSKINGLSDVGIRLVRANNFNDKVLVIYDNCNIDIIAADKSIRNYPDFRNKTLPGKKIVNEVSFFRQYAYLACGFGIVVFDTDKMEVKDTYMIGPNGADIDVQQVALNDSLIFAATESGLYTSNHLQKNLNSYKSWTRAKGISSGFYSGVVNVNNEIVAAYSPGRVTETLKNQDSLYSLYNGNLWQKYPPSASTPRQINRLGPTYQDKFTIIDATSVVVLKVGDGSIVSHLNSFNGVVDYGQIRDVYFSKDHTGNLSYWIADNRFGLYQTIGYYPYDRQYPVTKNGTHRTYIGNIDINDGRVAVSPAFVNNAGTPPYLHEGINIYKEREWSYLEVLNDDGSVMEDITSVYFDRKNKDVTWVAAWGNGIFKLENNKKVAAYTPSNTPMPVYTDQLPRCGGLSMDPNGNLWFAHSDQNEYLGVIRSNGKYEKLQFEAGRFTRKTYADKNGYIWILHERAGGLSVYKPDYKASKFATPVDGLNYRLLTSDPNKGNIDMTVYSVVEDHDGRIWIGTAAGIRVIYSPSSLFNSAEYAAQPIKIVQDGNVELLLDKEGVTCLAVDGANNKWCGTQLGGVYCFSPDGLKQLYHLTKENSSLYSNSIIDLNYDEKTGDVFIGTDEGLQSFRSIDIAGSSNYSDIHAYPNPVRPGYQGNVYIRGLVESSIVRIADEAGNMIWETKAEGGQIAWPLKSLAGSRVSSGVYIVYASTTNGEQHAVSKILVVNQ